MFPQPAHSYCIANETVVPVGKPPFEWAVFVTNEPSDDVIAYYAQILKRTPDEGGCKWVEPLDSVAVYPVEQVDKIPPSARSEIPPDARTLIFMLQRDQPRPRLEPYQDNVLPGNLSPASLLDATLTGRMIWAMSENGPVLKAGGRVSEGLHAGREIWITVGRQGSEFQLALTSKMQLYGMPIRQTNGWFRQCELARLWEAARTRASRSQG